MQSCDDKVSIWWREVEKLSGMNSAFNSKNEVYKLPENLNETASVTTKHLANISQWNLSPTNDFFACTDFGDRAGGCFEIVKSESSQGQWSGWDTQLGSEGKC
ncbi:Hypothetical predicted protein [Paramuricea clavata]|uniref:Uncharacterized protein n=1 Tax=Paramuricea clavata TaxID=317549 RepID=A0A7D9L8T9_PARCT|nr:Hypothetical predicted protein [Paramuricea clavata]